MALVPSATTITFSPVLHHVAALGTFNIVGKLIDNVHGDRVGEEKSDSF